MTALVIAWDHRDIALALALTAALWGLLGQQKKNAALLQQLADKPKVEIHTETKTVKGPVQIVEKIVTEPGGERIVYRTLERAETTTETEASHVEVPICPAPELARRWIVAAAADPLHYGNSGFLRGGVTIANRLDITYGHSITGPGRQAVDFAWRF